MSRFEDVEEGGADPLKGKITDVLKDELHLKMVKDRFAQTSHEYLIEQLQASVRGNCTVENMKRLN